MLGSLGFRHLLLLIVVAATLLAGCGRGSDQATASGSRGDTSEPTATVDESHVGSTGCDPNQAIIVETESDRGPPEAPENIVERAQLVITARVVEVRPARWTTPQGARPNPCDHEGPFTIRGNPAVEIVTPVIVEFDGEFVGGGEHLLDALQLYGVLRGDRLLLMIAGGRIDADQFINDSYGHSPYQVGKRVVLALAMYRPGADRWVGPWGYAVPWHLVEGAVWIPFIKWTVTEDDTAIADYQGSDPAELPLDDLLARIESVVPRITAGPLD